MKHKETAIADFMLNSSPAVTKTQSFADAEDARDEKTITNWFNAGAEE